MVLFPFAGCSGFRRAACHSHLRPASPKQCSLCASSCVSLHTRKLQRGWGWQARMLRTKRSRRSRWSSAHLLWAPSSSGTTSSSTARWRRRASSAAFFPTGSETVQTLLAWLGFAVGFGFRPLGAILFGYLGDKLGRKYTFSATITLMGLATAGVGLVPSAASIGFAAPVIVLLLRICQGLALGGEYGGAAIYVAEACAGGTVRLLYQLHPGRRRGRVHPELARGAGLQGRHDRGILGRLGLARTFPALDRPARGVGLDARQAQREPRVRGIEGDGQASQEPVRRELHLSRQWPTSNGRTVRRRGRASPSSGTRPTSRYSRF